MKIKTGYLFFVTTLAACVNAGSVPPPVDHNGPLPTGTDADCSAMCTHLRALHCPAGAPTPKGAPCEAVCMNTESSGYASENPRCQAKALSCDAADACPDSQ
jgi:hypothetical protein